MTEDNENIEVGGTKVPVVDDNEMVKLALSALPSELIPFGLAALDAGFAAMCGAVGPAFGAMAASDAIMKGLAVLDPYLRHTIAKMAIIAVAIASDEDEPEEMREPVAYAEHLRDQIAEVVGHVDWEKMRASFANAKAEMDKTSALEELFNLPDAERDSG